MPSSHALPAQPQAEAEEPPEAPPEPVGPLSPLRYPGFRFLWAGGFFSGAGQQMQAVVNSWLVYVLTDSPFQLGLIGAFQALPLILFSLAGGTLADTMDRKRLLLVTQGVRGLLGMLLLALTSTGTLQVWHLYAVSFVSTAVNVVNAPARQSILPTLLPRSHVTGAIVINSMTNQLNRMVGPGLAGIILAVAGPNAAYAATLAFFGLALGALISMGTPKVLREEGWPNMLALMSEGLKFVMKTEVILALLFLDAFATFFGAYEAMMPVFARDVLGVGPAGLGFLLAAHAVGGFAGSTSVMFLGNLERKGTMVLIVVFLYALCLIGFGLSPWFLVSLLFVAGLGGFNAIAVTLRNSIILLVTPDGLRGRVESIRFMFIAGAPALGGVQAGAAASLIGAPLTLATEALVVVAAILTIKVRIPQLWRLRI